MILNASGRCDVCGYFMPWLIKRIEAGYVDIRNPFYPKIVHRVMMDQVEGIVFCTKNPIPALGALNRIPWPMLFQVTLTPYKEEMEPGVPDKRLVIEAIKELSSQLGKNHVMLRYDPILISPVYTIEYHQMMFERLCSQLNESTETIIISFLDLKKNTLLNQKTYQYREPSLTEMRVLAQHFSEIAHRYHMKVQTCAEDIDLTEFGVENLPCISAETAYFLTKTMKKWKKGQRNECECISTVDIGAYNCCYHGCRYCYANYDEKQIQFNMKKHDPDSSLICGHLQHEDEIRVREN